MGVRSTWGNRQAGQQVITERGVAKSRECGTPFLQDRTWHMLHNPMAPVSDPVVEPAAGLVQLNLSQVPSFHLPALQTVEHGSRDRGVNRLLKCHIAHRSIVRIG